ncbi:MAG: GNAT family N-acetyltransferase [Gemmatimonadota bacterium]|nr:GNAT family N-acetyltransferase [Gemmatimonadota bacterium]
MSGIRIEALSASPNISEALGTMLIDVVANNGSVSFMHPLEPARAAEFWAGSLAAAARGERIVLGAFDDEAGGALVATVTLLLDTPQNQAHRGEIAKMMTRPSHRGRGIASALMREVERLAVEHGRTLLMLDTATVDGASKLYEALEFTFAGEIPDYALTPMGELTGTKIYWKRIGAAASR